MEDFIAKTAYMILESEDYRPVEGENSYNDVLYISKLLGITPSITPEDYNEDDELGEKHRKRINLAAVLLGREPSYTDIEWMDDPANGLRDQDEPETISRSDYGGLSDAEKFRYHLRAVQYILLGVFPEAAQVIDDRIQYMKDKHRDGYSNTKAQRDTDDIQRMKMGDKYDKKEEHYYMFANETVAKRDDANKDDDFLKTVYSKTGTLEFPSEEEAKNALKSRVEAINSEFGLKIDVNNMNESKPRQTFTNRTKECKCYTFFEQLGEGEKLVPKRGTNNKDASGAVIMQKEFDRVTASASGLYVIYKYTSPIIPKGAEEKLLQELFKKPDDYEL